LTIPGPWEADYDEIDDIIKGNEWIATVVKRVNTRLILAAPELLEALIELLKAETQDIVVYAEIRAEKAIEKATGKTWAEIREKGNV